MQSEAAVFRMQAGQALRIAPLAILPGSGTREGRYNVPPSKRISPLAFSLSSWSNLLESSESERRGAAQHGRMHSPQTPLTGHQGRFYVPPNT